MSDQEGKFVCVTVIASFQVEVCIKHGDNLNNIRERVKKFAEYATFVSCPECGAMVVGVLSDDMVIHECADMPELVE